MKKVTLTNATVIPFYKQNPQDPDEVLKVIRPKADAEFNSIIVSFNTETKVKDTAESKMRLFEKCTIYAKTEDKVKSIEAVIQQGAILEIEGYETRNKSQKDNKYYTNIVVNNLTPISGGIQEPGANLSTMASPTEEDLPF